MATYGGSAIFGLSVKCAMSKNPSAEQINAFFGVHGTQSLFGGTRGRVFMIEGVLFGTTSGNLSAAELVLLSYEDGIGRVLVDSYGRAWPSVVFRGEYSPQGRILRDFRGFYQEYKAIFHGRI
jgi:hypothetical protein